MAGHLDVDIVGLVIHEDEGTIRDEVGEPHAVRVARRSSLELAT